MGGDNQMRGWLYIISQNRFGIQNTRKRFFIFQDKCLKSFKAMPIADDKKPVRGAVIDSNMRVSDDGRETIRKGRYFIFTIYNANNHNDQLKLGASSSEEAARWIHSLQDAALKEWPDKAKDFVRISRKRWSSLSMCNVSNSKRPPRPRRTLSMDWISSLQTEVVTSDVIAPSPWKIFGCENGLRLFREAKDWDSHGMNRDDNNPAIMAVGTVYATSEAVFHALMSLSSTRSEWDFCFYRGSVVEHTDGHTDIVHKQLQKSWLPWGMMPRDLLLQRYWRREYDGTYVILYQSVLHKKCPSRWGYVRASLKSGGYVITPCQGNRSLVKHMLAIDWKQWHPAYGRNITIRMLERIATLREMLQAKSGNQSSDNFSEELTNPTELLRSENGNTENEKGQEDIQNSEGNDSKEYEAEQHPTSHSSLVGLNDSADEFFDVPEPTDNELLENKCYHGSSANHTATVPLSAADLEELRDLAGQKNSCVQETGRENSILFPYGTTLQKDRSGTLSTSWAEADPSSFLIRGENYLQNNHKVEASGTLMEMVGADWLRSDRREDDLGSRPGGIVQKYAELNGEEFFFIINIQVPGTPMYSIALYYMVKSPLESYPLLHSFVNGDDAYRNSRLKLIPYISKGSWIVKQSVGKKACLIAQALEANYVRGKNYLEVDIDVGSSTVARGVVSLVLGSLNSLVIELAFLIQSNTQEELPETLLGTCRLNNVDVAKSSAVER